MNKKDLTDLISGLDNDIIEECAEKRAEKYAEKATAKRTSGGGSGTRAAVIAVAAAAVLLVLSLSLVPILSEFGKKEPPVGTDTLAALTESAGTSSDTESGTAHASSGEETSASVVDTESSASDTESSAANETGTETATETETETAAETGTAAELSFIQSIEAVDEALKSGRYASSSVVPYEEPSRYPSLDERFKFRLYGIDNIPEGYSLLRIAEDDNFSRKAEYSGSSTFFFCTYNSVARMNETRNKAALWLFAFMNYERSKIPDISLTVLPNQSYGYTITWDNGNRYSTTVMKDENGDILWEYIEISYIYGTGAFLFRFDLEIPCVFVVNDGGPSLDELLAVEVFRELPDASGAAYITDGGGYLGYEFESLYDLITAFRTRSILNLGTGTLSFEYLIGVDPDGLAYLTGLPDGTETVVVYWYSGSKYQILYRDAEGRMIWLEAGYGISGIGEAEKSLVEKADEITGSNSMGYMYAVMQNEVVFINTKDMFTVTVESTGSASASEYTLQRLMSLRLEKPFFPDAAAPAELLF